MLSLAPLPLTKSYNEPQDDDADAFGQRRLDRASVWLGEPEWSNEDAVREGGPQYRMSSTCSTQATAPTIYPPAGVGISDEHRHESEPCWPMAGGLQERAQQQGQSSCKESLARAQLDIHVASRHPYHFRFVSETIGVGWVTSELRCLTIRVVSKPSDTPDQASVIPPY
jgi:hypothetical protein